jgi:hypothetical protein
MRRLVVWNAMTLDGYFEGKSPWDLGFLETIWGDELEAFSLEQGREIGTLLFGRRTYEGMASHWATATGAVADMMNSVEKAVATRTLDKATWNKHAAPEGRCGRGGQGSQGGGRQGHLRVRQRGSARLAPFRRARRRIPRLRHPGGAGRGQSPRA